MSKNKRTIIIAVALVAVLLAILGVLTYQISKNTWKHEPLSNDADWGTEINNAAETTYYVENVKKADFEDISAHGYIAKVTSVLNSHKDKLWLMFLFDDNTGIYYPGSDITESAFYGTVDPKTYEMTETYGTITISGTQVEYKKAPSYFSSESQSIYNIIPAEFTNDSTYANYDENIAYIQIATNRTDLTEIAQTLCDNALNLDLDISEVHIKINEACFKWTEAEGLVTTDWDALFIL